MRDFSLDLTSPSHAMCHACVFDTVNCLFTYSGNVHPLWLRCVGYAIKVPINDDPNVFNSLALLIHYSVEIDLMDIRVVFKSHAHGPSLVSAIHIRQSQ